MPSSKRKSATVTAKPKRQRSRAKAQTQAAPVPGDYEWLFFYKILANISLETYRQTKDSPETQERLRHFRNRLTSWLVLEAESALTSLRDKGCEEVELLWILAECTTSEGSPFLAGWADKPGVGSLLELFGLDSRQLSGFVSRLEDCALRIESVHKGTIFGQFLAVSADELLKLPRLLRLYANLLRAAREGFSPATHSYRNLAIAHLVSYVTKNTGSPRDRQVSALILAATRNDSYDSAVHAAWRNDPNNKQLISLWASVK